MELLNCLSVLPGPVRFELPTTTQADQSIDQWLARHRLDQFVVINPGASWRSKRWENDRFGTVANDLFQRYQLRSVITWAGDQEKEMAQEIFRLNPVGSIFAMPTSLAQLASLIRRARFFVGCDTGPMHIATAVGTPCVGLYGTTRPQESGAYGPGNRDVQKWYQSGSCKQRRNANNDAMRDIMASDVIAACDQMLESQVNAKVA
jgi:ADP-heptose:LPS heptosyltransferase